MLQAETTWHRLGTLWIGLCLLLAAVLAWQLPHSRINTSLMDLLPHASRSDLDPALQQGLLQQLDRSWSGCRVCRPDSAGRRRPSYG